jgi:hypothetical protein
MYAGLLVGGGSETLKLDELLVHGGLYNKKEPQKAGDAVPLADVLARLLDKLQLHHRLVRPAEQVRPAGWGAGRGRIGHWEERGEMKDGDWDKWIRGWKVCVPAGLLPQKWACVVARCWRAILTRAQSPWIKFLATPPCHLPCNFVEGRYKQGGRPCKPPCPLQ